MPTEGALIRATDYTDIRRGISRILGDKILDYPSDPDRGTYGYGQTPLAETLSIEYGVTIIDNIQMAALKSDVLRIARHCGIEFNAAITSLPDPQSSDLIDNAHLEAYQAAITYLNQNRFLLAESQSSTEDLIDQNTGLPITNSRTSSWGNNVAYNDATVRHSFTVDFGSADAARYFFNSGGEIRFTASRTGGNNTYQDQIWSSMLSQMGTVIYNYNGCSGDSGISSNIGFYDLTTTPQQVFTKGGGSLGVYTYQYASNDYTIEMSCNVANNSAGGARYIYVTVYFNDDHVASKYYNDTVSGTLTSTIKIRRASGSNVHVTAPQAYNTVLLSN